VQPILDPWVPFTADKEEFRIIPKEPGLYRIRPAGKDFLMYIGETRRTLHQRLNELRQSVRREDLMPWNDPHTAAPSLWAWRDAESERSSDLEEEKRHQTSSSAEKSSDLEEKKSPSGLFEYECSAAPLDASQAVRRGMESFLLYRYRQEYGESTLCNFGRFHKRYRKSTNRKEKLRGGKLEDSHKDNPAGGPSISPLKVIGNPGDPDWMGLTWSERKTLSSDNIIVVASGPGLYLLFDANNGEIIYIGQSGNCPKRLLDHSRKSWEGRDLQFSCHVDQTLVLAHNLKELENDLIGNYFELNRKAPEYQLGNST
jgi:hypothetical protein